MKLAVITHSKAVTTTCYDELFCLLGGSGLAPVSLLECLNKCRVRPENEAYIRSLFIESSSNSGGIHNHCGGWIQTCLDLLI